MTVCLIILNKYNVYIALYVKLEMHKCFQLFNSDILHIVKCYML